MLRTYRESHTSYTPDHLPETDAAFEKMRTARLAAMQPTQPQPDTPRQWLDLQMPEGSKVFFLATPQELAAVDAATVSSLYATFREKTPGAGRFAIYAERVGANWQISNIVRLDT